jgi:hypothetical protein
MSEIDSLLTLDNAAHGGCPAVPCSPSVAVLFARADSIYKSMEGVDVWDADRDATKYRGEMPVVAHPPCRSWGALAHMAKPRPGEKSLALWSLNVVRMFGGVLEHPASSKLWPVAKLPEPGEVDGWGGWTLAAPQMWWGHKAEKKSRFYIVGCTPKDLPPIPFMLGEAECVVTTSKRKCKTPPSEWKERLNPKDREGTPADMAAWLIAVARICRGNTQLADKRA